MIKKRETYLSTRKHSRLFAGLNSIHRSVLISINVSRGGALDGLGVWLVRVALCTTRGEAVAGQVRRVGANFIFLRNALLVIHAVLLGFQTLANDAHKVELLAL